MYNPQNPLEVQLLTRRFRLPNSHRIDTYLANEGYKALEKALAMSQDDIINEVKASGLRGRYIVPEIVVDLNGGGPGAGTHAFHFFKGNAAIG